MTIQIQPRDEGDTDPPVVDAGQNPPPAETESTSISNRSLQMLERAIFGGWGVWLRMILTVVILAGVFYLLRV